MARRSYLQRIAEPVAPGSAVVSPSRRAWPEEARPSVAQGAGHRRPLSHDPPEPAPRSQAATARAHARLAQGSDIAIPESPIMLDGAPPGPLPVVGSVVSSGADAESAVPLARTEPDVRDSVAPRTPSPDASAVVDRLAMPPVAAPRAAVEPAPPAEPAPAFHPTEVPAPAKEMSGVEVVHDDAARSRPGSRHSASTSESAAAGTAEPAAPGDVYKTLERRAEAFSPDRPIAETSERTPPRDAAGPRAPQERKGVTVHIGLIEVRTPVSPAPPRVVRETVAPRGAVSPAPLGRGLAWRFGFIQS